MAESESLKEKNMEESVRRYRLKHAVDKVLETQEILAKHRTELKPEEVAGGWEATKAKVSFNYYMTVLKDLIKESVKEDEKFVVVFHT